ncbi:MAG: murein hydrolase activator EnvC family protein [Paludibacteraceae bacterium]
MIADKQKESFSRRVLHKYRLIVTDESTLKERWHFKLSFLGLFCLLFILFMLTLVLFSVLIIYTPIRNVLPGNSQNVRQQLIMESARVDSIETDLQLQRQYLEVIKQVTAGEVQTDTVQSLDSLQIVMREQLLAVKEEALQEFVEQYESKDKDNLQLFDVQSTQPVASFFRPLHGVVVTHFQPENKQFGVVVRSTENENITAVLTGTVVYVTHELDDTFTMILQHQNYVSIYRHVGKVLKQTGSNVQSGESIALVGAEGVLGFELWRGGQYINPEEVIAF